MNELTTLPQQMVRPRIIMYDLEHPENGSWLADSLPDDAVDIHTSDRQNFKRCRLRWSWTSPIRSGLRLFDIADYFWIGSLMHFALEDFHGWNIYGDMRKALLACVVAQVRADPQLLSMNWKDQFRLAVSMADYYQNFWLVDREPLDTLWLDGQPQVELTFAIKLPPSWVDGRRNIYYVGTFDRVVVAQGEKGPYLRIQDWKIFKEFRSSHYDKDPQVRSYLWAANLIYNLPVGDLIIQQFRKELVMPPRVTTRGTLSIDKSQPTTFSLYRDALLTMYGSVERAPGPNIDYLNWLADNTHSEGDNFIRRIELYRDSESLAQEVEFIKAEAREMSNPNIPIYPNPTQECKSAFRCAFTDACQAVMEGRHEDVKHDLGYVSVKKEEWQSWRKFLPTPGQLQADRYTSLLSKLSNQPLPAQLPAQLPGPQ
jgi:hypothetical protein